MYVPMKDKIRRLIKPKELMEHRKARLGIDKNMGIEAEKGLKSDFYLKVIGPKLNEEREKAIVQISQPKPESSMERLSAKLELIEVIRKDISSVIERGRKAGIELEEIRKQEDVR